MSQSQKASQQQHIEWLRNSATRQEVLPQKRLEQAWQVARDATKLLKEQYGVKRVRVFGSLLHPDQFHTKSDIDLAVEGLAIQDYWDAVTDVLFLNNEITIDLIDPETCSPGVWAAVEQKGVDL